MKPHLLAAFLCACLQNTALSGILPKIRLDNLFSSDGSVSQCMVLDCTAGIHYEIETSTDLVVWETAAEFYGLGQTFSHPLRTFTPAPAPDPSAPPPAISLAARNASIVITPSPAGGTVVSWTSFETQTGVTVVLDDDMHPAWTSIPLYYKTFGQFHLFVLPPTASLAGPTESPTLTGADAELLQTLVENFAAMNAEVATSAATARHTPPPATSTTIGRLFARCRARQVDSDQDGTFDDAEFRLLLAPGGHPLANPFLADADNNGVPDGHQLDSDNDSIPDANDWAPQNSELALVLKTPPRYAFFEIDGIGEPLEINDLGTVLYHHNTWKAGTLRPLAGGGEAIAINDNDHIIGYDTRAAEINGEPWTFSSACHWTVTGNTRHWVQTPGTSPRYANPARNRDSATRAFSNDGCFNADVQIPLLGMDHDMWRISPGSANASFFSRHTGDMRPTISSSVTDQLMWGFEPLPTHDPDNPANNGNVGIVYAPNKLPTPSFIPNDVIRLEPSGDILALNDGVGAEISRGGGAWTDSDLYARAVDASADGIAIARSHSDLASPILINGTWQDIRRTAPGIHERWHTPDAHLHDTTPGGWILARILGAYDPAVPPAVALASMKTGVMLPIRLKGVPPDPAFSEATGVDDFSIGSTDPGSAVKDRFWIMAPFAGERPTAVILEAPLNAATPLQLSAPGVDFNASGTITLNAPSTTFGVTGTTSGLAGSDQPAILKFGNTESSSIPIGIKPMKARTVQVTLWRIRYDQNPANVYPDDPGYKIPDYPHFDPDPTEIEAWLNSYYYPQVNAAFNVTILEGTVKWDNPNPGRNSLNTTEDGAGEFETIREAHFDATADINVYVLARAGTIILPGAALGLDGLAFPNINSAAIADRTFTTNEETAANADKEMFDTIAHEIGHIMIGPGHPDLKFGPLAGPAPCPGTDYTKRLLTNGWRRVPNGSACRLVKGEWDRIEDWLKTNIDRKRP